MNYSPLAEALKRGGQLKDPMQTKWLEWHGVNRCWYISTREPKKHKPTVLGRFDDNEQGLAEAVKILLSNGGR